MPSANFQTATHAEATDEIFLVLLTIDHADLGAPLRFVNNGENIVSNGETFLAFPFEWTDAEQSSAGAGIARLKIDNVDRQIAETIRTLTTAPSVSMDIVLASDPDTVERSAPAMIMPSASWDALEVSADLSVLRDDEEPACSWSFTPDQAAALF